MAVMTDEDLQIIKTRDDYAAVRIRRDPEPSDPTRPFVLSAGTKCSWAGPDESVGTEVLRQRIEPWLTALVQSEHLSLLVGSGLTQAVHRIATDTGLPAMDTTTFGVFDDEISREANRIAKSAQRDAGNFEDQIRVAGELLRGLEILAIEGADTNHGSDRVSALRKALSEKLRSFAASILEAEQAIVTAPSHQREQALNYLVSFLMSFASRSGTRERLNLYTTNYDRYLEAGSDVAGLRTVDRFVGTLSPIFRASRLDIDLHYNPPGIRGEPRYLEGVARFTKLHGSIDWVDDGGAIRRIGLPFGAGDIGPFLSASDSAKLDARRLMIYPNSAKDRETAHYPYVELFRDLATAICRPNSTLVCYGYSFGDEHINRVIEDMLTIPSTHLVIISYSDPLGRIINTYDRVGRPAQITLLLGDHFGDLQVLVDRYLPRSAIDRTTVRMAELLKARWNTVHGESATNQHAISQQKMD